MATMEKVLITGGAGFIGSHIAEALIRNRQEVTILDNFNPQVHGNSMKLSPFLQAKAKLVVGDVTDKKIFVRAIEGQDSIVHLAAETGTGQSMYQIENYSRTNIVGTSILCDYLVNNRNSVKKIVLASSRAVYGEGKYRCENCGIIYPDDRKNLSDASGGFEPLCPGCASNYISALPTDEDSKIHPSSVYGITKQVQEQILLLTARMAGINACAFRFQNVYGPGQSLINPYTGILSIFFALAKNNEDINIFEDGKESRDFVYIEDAVRVVLTYLDTDLTGQYIFNVGSGERITVLEVAEEIVRYLKSATSIKVTGTFRQGDIRHNFADLNYIGKLLDYKPHWKFRDGLHVFLDWACHQASTSVSDGYRYYNSLEELRKKGLYK